MKALGAWSIDRSSRFLEMGVMHYVQLLELGKCGF
jgi:hypothetical protein